MSTKASLAGALAAAAVLAGIGPAFSHTIVGNRLFPATIGIDDPGVNDELTLPSFAYVANPDGSLQYDFHGAWQKTITPDLSFSVGSAFTHLVNAQRLDGSVGTINGWQNIETQLKYVPYQNAEHEFIVAAAGSIEWGHTGNASVGADPVSSITAKIYVGKGFGDLDVEWLRPFAVTGEMDYTWSTHPTNVTLGVDPDSGLPTVSIDRTPTVLTYGATIQYSLLYMNSFVHEVPEFFRQLIPTVEAVFATPVSNIGPSVLGAVPGTHQTVGTIQPGIFYIGRIGAVSFELGAEALIPVNRASGKHVGAVAILDFFLDDMFPDTLGKPIFGAHQTHAAGLY
jgi:hypothetical protein